MMIRNSLYGLLLLLNVNAFTEDNTGGGLGLTVPSQGSFTGGLGLKADSSPSWENDNQFVRMDEEKEDYGYDDDEEWGDDFEWCEETPTTTVSITPTATPTDYSGLIIPLALAPLLIGGIIALALGNGTTTTSTRVSVPTVFPGGPGALDYRCGPGIRSCQDGNCCSQFGWCGKDTAWCGAGCQEGFGNCGTPPAPPAAPITSGQFQCGQGVGSCPGQTCCSRYGYCGTGPAWCGEGCKISFGVCESTRQSLAAGGSTKPAGSSSNAQTNAQKPASEAATVQNGADSNSFVAGAVIAGLGLVL
ncbi:hypothetical protein BC833DRAFT_612176 [Globomyces pollinis-pini]|nr:hypothetical protein BC833DRAFT_612176 [Globomyces pollinis-pini]